MTGVRVIGYTRMSPGEAGLDGYELDHQRDRLAAECESRGWELVDVHSETVALDDRATIRRALRDAIASVAKGDADVLMVDRADRIGIGARAFYFVGWLGARDKAFVALDVDWDTTTPVGKEVSRVVGHLGDSDRWLHTSRESPALGRPANEKLVQYIPPGSSVVDLGSGNQSLRRLLPDDCDYQAMPTSSTPRTRCAATSTPASGRGSRSATTSSWRVESSSTCTSLASSFPEQRRSGIACW